MSPARLRKAARALGIQPPSVKPSRFVPATALDTVRVVLVGDPQITRITQTWMGRAHRASLRRLRDRGAKPVEWARVRRRPLNEAESSVVRCLVRARCGDRGRVRRPFRAWRGLLAQRADSVAAADPSAPGTWRQWGGPNRNFLIHGDRPGRQLARNRTGRALEPAARHRATRRSSPTRPAVHDVSRRQRPRRAVAAVGRRGESVVALDAKTGQTIWEHKYPSRREDFSFGAGPHSTPLVVGDRVFTIGTNQQMFAFDKRSGKVLWSHDFIKEFNSPELLIRPVVKTGYGCSPIAFRDTIICSVGGPGQSVMAFRQSDGGVVWKSGDFLTSAAAPILIELRRAAAARVSRPAARSPDSIRRTAACSGRTPHDPGNDLNCGTPIWGADDILFVSSAYKAGSRAIQLTQQGRRHARRGAVVHQPRAVHVPERDPRRRLRLRHDRRFRPGVSHRARTSRPARRRGSIAASAARASSMRTARRSSWTRTAISRWRSWRPKARRSCRRRKIFDTTSWTVPTLVGTTLYARDREKIVALDLGHGAAQASAPSRFGSAERADSTGGQHRRQLGILRHAATVARWRGTWRLDTAQSRDRRRAPGLAGLIARGRAADAARDAARQRHA